LHGCHGDSGAKVTREAHASLASSSNGGWCAHSAITSGTVASDILLFCDASPELAAAWLLLLWHTSACGQLLW
jgi:hypothetical protein